MNLSETLQIEYSSLLERINEYKAALMNNPEDWILAMHLSRAENRLKAIQEQGYAKAA